MKRFISAFILMLAFSASQASNTVTLNLVPPASNNVQQGFVRLINRNEDAASVEIQGVDDRGFLGAETIRITLDPGQSLQLNSDDLEFGNPNKGLMGGFGNGNGNWRIYVTSIQEIGVAGYIRTSNGFLTQIDAVAEEFLGKVHEVPIFNPASNTNQISRLRLINDSAQTNRFAIYGVDDAGIESELVTINLDPFVAVELTAQDLENGAPDKGLEGEMGDGQGKWFLNVVSLETSTVMNLIEVPGGYLSNLSTLANRPAQYESLTCADMDGAKVYSSQEPPVYLGFLGASNAAESIYNSIGQYGSSTSPTSMRNPVGTYGSTTSILSHLNTTTLTPPIIVDRGNSLAAITSNDNPLIGGFSLAALDNSCNFTAPVANDTFAAPSFHREIK